MASLRNRRAALALAALVVVLAIPLVIALGVLAEPRWYPLLDDAQTELRVRDVGSEHLPLVGLPGRIGSDERRGSHPGPLSFWTMAPVYRFLGSSSWALQAASVSLHLLAVGTTLWIAHRRGGVRLAIAVAVMLAVLLRMHGASTLTQPWNPFLPLFWWMVVLMAAWSLTLGDHRVLPVAVFAASFCMQTHVPYVGPSAGLLAAGFAVLVWRCFRSADRDARRGLWRWFLASVALGAVLWAPPVVDQLTNSPGNLRALWRHFATPPEAPIGLGEGARLMLVHLNVWRLLPGVVPGRWVLSGSALTGSLALAVWAMAVLVAAWLRHRALLSLHLVLGLAMILGALSLSRIFGFPWYYLSLWAFGITALVVLSVVWAAVALLGRSLPPATAQRAGRTGGVVLAGVVALWAVLFTIDAAYTAPPFPAKSEVVGRLAAPTVAALEDGAVAGGGRDGRYLVDWVDPIGIGSQGFGLLLELERQGLDVGYDAEGAGIHRVGATPHRLVRRGRADAVVHLAIGQPDLERWRSRRDAEEVASFDPRTSTQREEYERLRTEIVGGLRTAGLAALAAKVDEDLFAVSLDGRVPPALRVVVARMLELGLPTAVFVAPADAR